MTKAKPSPEVYGAIGRISVEFNLLEFLVRVCIPVLLGTDNDRGTVVSSEMQFRQLLNTFAQLYRRRFPFKKKDFSGPQEGELAEFTKLVRRIRKVEEERNGVLHSMWDPVGGKATVFGQKWGVRGDEWYQPRFAERSVEDFDHLADKIESVAEEVAALHSKLVIEAIRKGRP